MTTATVIGARRHMSFGESGVPAWMLATPDCQALRRHGILVAVSLLVGYDGETAESLDNTRRLLEEARPDVARINVYRPRPEDRGGAEGRLPMEPARAWATAAWLARNTDQVFVSPFESFLDLYSALRARQVPPGEILRGAAEHSRRWKDILRDDVSP